MLKKRTGFTLMELVVTTAVMGTLAAVATPRFSDASEVAKLKKSEANIDNIISGAQGFYNERVMDSGHGRFPEQLTSRGDVITGSNLVSIGTVIIDSYGNVLTAIDGEPVFGSITSEWFDVFPESFISPYESLYNYAIYPGTVGIDAISPILVVWDDLDWELDLDFPAADGTGGEPYRIFIP